MEQVALGLLRELGGQWLSLALAAAWLLYKSGVVQWVCGIEAGERAQLSSDQQRLVENMQHGLERLDQRLTDEREDCARQLAEGRAERERRIAELREECDRELKTMRDNIDSLVRGESRWRHLVGNLAAYVAALQLELRKVGVEVPRFGGWDKFIAEGGDPLLPQFGPS